MKRILKRLAALTLTAAITGLCGSTALAGEWVDGYFGGQRYRKDDGYYASDEWIHHGGSWYLTDILGEKCIGWFKRDDKWYYLDENGVMACDGTHNINGVDYRFDASGAWIQDQASMDKGRVYRSPEYNIELTVPYYYEMDMHSYLMPTFTDTRSDQFFYIHLGEFNFNMPLEDVVNYEVEKYKRLLLTVEKVETVTLNGREYTKVLAYDTADSPLWCYQEYYYVAKNEYSPTVTSLTFSYNAEANRDKEIAEILATVRSLE